MLATVTHFNSEVLQLWLTGAAAPLEPTAEHKVFSADRRAWVAARELVAGERLQTRRGPVALERIASRPARTGGVFATGMGCVDHITE